MVASMSINSTINAIAAGGKHKSNMERMYRVQRHFYDATRAYYLLGRDQMINRLNPPRSGSVLEIGCGTGRNIVKASQRYPDAKFFGIDISDEMLKSAVRSLTREQDSSRVRLAQADALTFDPERTFGQKSFDRIYFSYTLSMIPDWQGAISRALQLLSLGGELHIVDFGQCEKMPAFFRHALFRWLNLFHVHPRKQLANCITSMAEANGRSVKFQSWKRGYAWSIIVRPLDTDV